MTVSRSPSIRSRLALLVMGCVVPALAIAVLLLTYDYQRAQAQLVRESMATARAIASALDGDLASITSSLNSLATSPYLTSNDFAAFYDQAKEVLRIQGGDNIVLSDLSGRQYINTLRPYGVRFSHTNAKVHMKKMADTGEPMISDLFFGPVFGRPAIAVGVPVHRDGKFCYNLSTGIFAERFVKVLHQPNLPQDWIAVILDGSGTIVARTHEMERFIAKKGAPDLISRISNVREGTFEGITLEGIPVLMVFSRSAISNWTVAIGIPMKSLSNELWRTLSWLILDGFKMINDRHGHATGDKLLRAVAERLKTGIRDSDLAARLGGDEFAIVLVDATAAAAAEVAEKLVDALSHPYVIDELTVVISACIGVAGFPDAGATGKVLLHSADDAMYEAKALGKRRVVVAKA